MRLATVILALAFVGALSACGGDDGPSDVDKAVSKLEKASGGPPDTVPDEPPSAPTLIRSYFDLIDQDQFSDAWSLLEPDVQEQFGGLESWRGGYATNTSTDVVEADVTSTAGEEMDVTVRIQAVDSCDGERYETEFEGPWSVDLAQGKITEADFAQVSGSGPPSDCG